MPQKKTMIYGFWERFDKACNKAGYSKAQLAREIGCDRRTLYEGDGSIPNSLYIARAALKLHVTADYLLGIERR